MRILSRCKSESGKHRLDREPETKAERNAAKKGFVFCSNKGCLVWVHYPNYLKVKKQHEKAKAQV